MSSNPTSRDYQPGDNAMRSTGQASQVGRDVQNVVTEAQELLKTVKDEGANRIDDMRTKVSAQLDTAKQRVTEQIDVARQKFGEIQTTVTDGAQYAMTTTDAYVKANPWRAVGIAAAAGALVGFLAARSR